MRTTLEIDDDILAAAKDLARRRGASAGAVISALARSALIGKPVEDEASASDDPGLAGFRPFRRRGVVVTNEDIDTLRDRDGL